MPTIAPLSDLLSTTAPTLHIGWVIACGVVGLVLVLTPARLIVVLHHEAGHAIAGIVFGAGFDGIELHRDGTGWTTASTYSTPGAIGIGIAGYLAPGLFGLLTVWAYSTGRTTLVLAALALICGVTAIMSGNLFGFLFSGFLAALAGWVLLDGAALAQSLLVLLLAWMLLLGGLFDSIGHLLGGYDHELLENMTGVPGVLWGLGFIAVQGWAAYNGARLLLGV